MRLHQSPTVRTLQERIMLLCATSMTPLLLLVAAASASIAASGEVPRFSNFKCHLDDSKCLKSYLQNEVIGQFSKGFPDFEVKSLDPLHFQDLSFNDAVGPATQFILNHSKPILYGLSKTKILEVRSKLSGTSFNLEVAVSIPKLFYEGGYTCSGEWLLFPVEWSGYFNMSMGGITDTWKIRANIIQKGDDAFLDLEDMSVGPKIASFNTYATGLFWGHEEVANFALMMTNRYWNSFYDVMWKLAAPNVLDTVSDAVGRILMKTPISRLGSLQLPFVPHIDSYAD